MNHDRAINFSGVRIAKVGNATSDRTTVRASAVRGVRLGMKAHVTRSKNQYVVRVISKIGEEAIGSTLSELSGVSKGRFDCSDCR